MSVNIDSIRRRLLVKYPSFGSVVANAKFVENNSIDTAATDGECVYYNPQFVNSLNSDEQVFLFAHEICHIAFDHIFRREGKIKELWNIATDGVINAFLMQDGLPLIEGGVNIPDAINYNAEDLYNKLLEENKQNQNNGNNQNSNFSSMQCGSSSSSGDGNDNGSSSSNQGEHGDSNSPSSSDDSNQNKNAGHDDHDIWDRAIEKRKKEEEEKNKGNSKDSEKEKEKDEKSFFDKLFNRNKNKKKNNEDKKEEQSESKTSESEKKKNDEIKKLSEQGEKKTFEENKKERKKQLQDMKDSLIRDSHGAGNDTSSIYRQVQDIGVSKPLIDWRLLLKEAVKYEVDWSYQNATIEDGVVTAHLEEIPQPETEIVLDTSGSIDETLLRNFLRECKNILYTSKVKVGCFDTKFYGFNEIRNENDIDTVKLQGGGGTNFDVAVNAFSRRIENKIIFTDGEASMPKMTIDAIWVVFGDKKINPPGGKVIYISYEELRRLSSNSYGGRTR